jgi:hypothetical protein
VNAISLLSEDKIGHTVASLLQIKKRRRNWGCLESQKFYAKAPLSRVGYRIEFVQILRTPRPTMIDLIYENFPVMSSDYSSILLRSAAYKAVTS